MLPPAHFDTHITCPAMPWHSSASSINFRTQHRLTSKGWITHFPFYMGLLFQELCCRFWMPREHIQLTRRSLAPQP